MDRSFLFARIRLPAVCCAIAAALAAIPALADTNYAVLFSGGVNPGVNHVYYYTETLRMWDIVVNKLHFPASDVYVLFADGTNPAADLDSGASSDWSQVVAGGSTVEAATPANLQSVLGSLGATMTRDSSFYFWSFDHGGNSDPPTRDNAVLAGWGGDIADDEFASWVSPFHVKAEIYAFAQCFSGGMVDDLNITRTGNRFAAWAAAWDEFSYGSGWAAAWADALSKQGLMGTYGLAQYAWDNDIFATVGLEHPGFTGQDFDIVTNEVVPEPSAGLLLGSVMWLVAGIAWWRGRAK